MNTNKIREALEFGVGLASARRYETGKDHSMVIRAFQEAIAELDKAQQPAEPVAECIGQFGCARETARRLGMKLPVQCTCTHPPQAQQPGKVLTDEHYRIIADRMIEEHRKYGDRLRPGHWADVAARKVASHLADFGYIAPAAGLTVDEVMDVMDEWTRDKPDSFRSRLTAALEAKTRTA